MEFCPHCMKPASGDVCPSCGGALDWTAGAGQLPLGTLLQGSDGHTYQIGAAKGQGGFGITYAAMDLTTAGRVAIKEYFPTRCAARNPLNQVMPMTGQNENYQGGMKSFLEEAMMLSAVGALSSVVSVRDYFEANGTAYLVMEYVDGVPLHQIVSQRGQIPAEELMPKLPALLADLEILHKAGVIHRDISPDNLMLMPDGRLKLLDFGSARSIQDGKSMTVLLKAGFSPVEQYQSRGQGPWTDVYALAATVYYCLTCVIPPSSVERLDDDTLKRPTELGAKLTPEQEEALLWGMTVQPKRRPVNMGEFAKRLFRKEVPICGGKFAPLPPLPAEEEQKTVSVVQEEDPAPEVEKIPVQDQLRKEKETEGEEAHPLPPIPPRPKKNPLLWVIIGIAGAALLAVIIWVIVYVTSHGTTEEGLAYEIKDGKVRITEYEGVAKNLEIPDLVKNKPVREIAYNAFDDCYNLTTVTLSRNLESLDWGAFDNCDELSLVVVEGSGLRMGSGTFRDCDALRCILFQEETCYTKHVNDDLLDDLSQVTLCYVGQETSGGKLQSVRVVGDVVYAITDQQMAAVICLPLGMDGNELDPYLGAYAVVLEDGRTPGQVDPVYGEVDGYSYEITPEGICRILGYTGEETVLMMPDEIEGIPVTVIAENAFADNGQIRNVYLPIELECIESGAFRGCGDLRDICVYSRVQSAEDAFEGCGMLRAVIRNAEENDMSGWTLPVQCQVYLYQMETGVGALESVVVTDERVIYGITSDSQAVVLSVPGDATDLYLETEIQGCTVTWVNEEALNNCESETIIHLAGEIAFPLELIGSADWKMTDAFGFSGAWLFSSLLCSMINEERRAGEEIYPQRELVQAAMARTRELMEVYDSNRPDGSGWNTLLEEYTMDWSYASTYRDYLENDEDTGLLFERMEEIVDYYAPAVEETGEVYTSLGYAIDYDETVGRIYVACFVIQ